MKCPECDAWTRVIRTYGAWRRRECGNLHRFNTLEHVTDLTGPSSSFRKTVGGTSTEPSGEALPWKRNKK